MIIISHHLDLYFLYEHWLVIFFFAKKKKNETPHCWNPQLIQDCWFQWWNIPFTQRQSVPSLADWPCIPGQKNKCNQWIFHILLLFPWSHSISGPSFEKNEPSSSYNIPTCKREWPLICDSPSTKDILCQFWSKLAYLFFKKRWKYEMFTDRRQVIRKAHAFDF